MLDKGEIIVVNSNVPKYTGQVVEEELNPKSWVNQNLISIEDGRYEGLVSACKCLRMALEEIFRASEGVYPRTLSERLDDLCRLTTRLQGALTFLGFSFPVADEILGTVANTFGEERRWIGKNRSIGGKITGGGHGGSLIFVIRAETGEEFHEKIDKAILRLQEKYPNPRSSICILYSARLDGIESKGLIREKKPFWTQKRP